MKIAMVTIWRKPGNPYITRNDSPVPLWNDSGPARHNKYLETG